MFDSSDGSDARALTRLRVCVGSSDHSLLVNEIHCKYQHIRHYEPFDIRKRVSKIRDEKELARNYKVSGRQITKGRI